MSNEHSSVLNRWKLDKEPRSENVTQCFFCKNNLPGGKCLAFPNGIPEEIQRNFVIHDKKYEGDNGILFKAKKEEYDNIKFEPMRKKSIDEIINKK